MEKILIFVGWRLKGKGQFVFTEQPYPIQQEEMERRILEFLNKFKGETCGFTILVNDNVSFNRDYLDFIKRRLIGELL